MKVTLSIMTTVLIVGALYESIQRGWWLELNTALLMVALLLIMSMAASLILGQSRDGDQKMADAIHKFLERRHQ